MGGFYIDWSGELVAFFAFAVVMIVGAVLMLTLTKVVHMVVSLAAVFLGLGGMFVVLEAEFVAFVQVLIYSGAVTILLLFGIMMTDHQAAQHEPTRPVHEIVSAVAAIVLFGILFYAIRTTEFAPSAPPLQAGVDNAMEIGKQLYTQHVIPFELVSVLLTVAFIGAIVIAKKEAE
jgi:NADH-quinone oxidoreductase subunit J